MMCKDCGKSGFQGTDCPDCGSSNVVEGGDNVANNPETAVSSGAVAGPSAPDMPPVMPEVEMQLDVKGPVVGTISLPDKRKVPLHDGKEFTVAHTATKANVDFRVDDETVSSMPVRIFARNGDMYATGGGGAGFALEFRYGPDEVVKIPRGVRVAVQVGQVGRDTRFPVR